MEHKEFAEIYDIFMKHVDYDSWYNFLRSFIREKGTLLDLGCGTGEFSIRFLRDGFSVTGVDLSEKMLDIAEKKIADKKLENCDFKLIKENIIDFENTFKNGEICQVDNIICNFDTVNYLKNGSEFEKFLEKCSKNLKKKEF